MSPKLAVFACLLPLLRVKAEWGWPSLPFFLNPVSVVRGLEDFSQFVDKSQLPQRNFTWSEVGKGDGRGGRPLYIVLDNYVYDVTDFADMHAGGSHHLRGNAGKDVSKLMRAAGMPDYVLNQAINSMAAEQSYTIVEVATRNGRGGAPAWIIYKDSVYDVTSYVTQHPGGDVILDEAGNDATGAFDDVDHSADAHTILKKYKIGEITEEEKKYDANGKKKKRVVAAAPETSSRSCMSVVSCGLMG